MACDSLEVRNVWSGASPSKTLTCGRLPRYHIWSLKLAANLCPGLMLVPVHFTTVSALYCNK